MSRQVQNLRQYTVRRTNAWSGIIEHCHAEAARAQTGSGAAAGAAGEPWAQVSPGLTCMMTEARICRSSRAARARCSSTEGLRLLHSGAEDPQQSALRAVGQLSGLSVSRKLAATEGTVRPLERSPLRNPPPLCARDSHVHVVAPRRRERRVRDVEVLHLSPLPAARAKHNGTILSL